MVEREIPYANRPAESAGFFLGPETTLPKPSQVFYAGQSHRRNHYLSTRFEFPVATFNVDPEPKTNDLGVIVNHKIGVALSSGEVVKAGEGLVIAADTQTIVPVIDDIGAFKKEYKIKPTSEGEVLNLFSALSVLPLGPRYAVVAASASHDVGTGTRSLIHQDRTDIELDDSTTAYLASRRGFDDYRKLFAEFYGGQVYARNGLPQIELCNISSGLSLPVLTKIGAVKEIDGVEISKRDEFNAAFQKALHVVAIGINPELFRGYSLVECEWVSEVTDAVLS